MISDGRLLGAIVATLLLLVSPALSTQQTHQEVLVLPNHGDINVDGRVKVPGNSPTYYCDDPSNDLFAFDWLFVHPDPIRRGHPVTLIAEGHFLAAIGESPTLTLSGTYNGDGTIRDTNPFCSHVDVIQNGTRSCPAEKGEAVMTFMFDIYPGMFPDGNYTIRAETRTLDERRIFCFQASVISSSKKK